MKETQEHERALKGDHKIFLALGLSKTDIDGYVDRVKTQFKVLIDSQLINMQSKEIIMKL